MKNIIIVTTLLTFYTLNIFSQEIKNRLFFYGGFQSTDIQIDETNQDNLNLSTKISTNPKIGLSFEHYISDKSGVSFNIGYSNLTKYFIYKLDKFSQDSLLANNLNWNEEIRIPNDQQYLSFGLSFVYKLLDKEKSKLSLIAGGHFRYTVFDDTYSSSNMFYENEEDFSQAIGPKSYETFSTYKKVTINPNFTLRYERKSKFNNSYGLSITFNAPLIKNYEGQIHILPENDDLKSSFQYYSRGGFLGINLFYGIGFVANK